MIQKTSFINQEKSRIEPVFSIEKKQPNILYLFCFIEMCERFSHYTMRVIIVLYMIKILLFSNEHAYGVFASFSALLFFTPFLGGYIADQYLDIKQAILIGGLLLTIGYALLAISDIKYFYFALGLVAIGSGFFIPNMSNAVGQLYTQNDVRREGGYAIFYGAINLGALIPPILIGSLTLRLGWNTGFIAASTVIALGTVLFYLINHFQKLDKQFTLKKIISIKTYFLLILNVLLLTLLFSQLIKYPGWTSKIVFLFGACFLFYIFKKSLEHSKAHRDRLMACFFLTLFSIIFEILLLQTTMSMTVFVERHVQRNFIVWQMPTTLFQSLNPLFIICFAPIFAKLWLYLDNKKLNLSVPSKFALGTLLMGCGFLILSLGISVSHSDKLDFLWIVLSYLLQSWGELCISPIGLSMITATSPQPMIGLMVGLWYFATAIASLLAGLFSQWTINLSDETTAYAHVFEILGMISIASSLIIFPAIRQLKKLLSSENHENEMTDTALSNLDFNSS
ncbi:MAG: amino acid/peptide transporter [uncultured bacterium]|nr:MAG: amino acid/peptide transporter [uncultured bacterium]